MKYVCNFETFEFTTILENSEKATLFRHFKNKYYKILTIAKDSENLNDIVIYQKQYDDFSYYTRDSKMFFSDVDKIKYPDVKQKKRFEIIK